MQSRRAGREAASPKNIKASPTQARRIRKIPNSGAIEGRKNETIRVHAPPAVNKKLIPVSLISYRFENRKAMQIKSTAHGYTPLRVKYSDDRYCSDLKGLNAIVMNAASTRKNTILNLRVMIFVSIEPELNMVYWLCAVIAEDD